MGHNLNPELCKYFRICSYNLCPLDPKLELRTYDAQDPYQTCRLLKYNELKNYLTQTQIKKYLQLVKQKIKEYEIDTIDDEK